MKKQVVAALLCLFVLSLGFAMGGQDSSESCPSCSSTAKPASATGQQSSSKKQSTTKKICSSIMGILRNEIGKTKNKTKLDILKGGLDYANDVCDGGGAPDLARITKGLPEKDKARISQKTNAALFDGAPDRPDKDFGPDTSKTAATLTGTGGQVIDLKSSEPNTPRFSQVTEFSLASVKTAQASTAKASSAPPCPLPGEARVKCCCVNNPNKCWQSNDKDGLYCYSVCTDIILDLTNCPLKFWLDFVTVISNLPELVKIEWESFKTIFFNLWELIKVISRAVWDALVYIFGNIWNAIKAAGGWIAEKYHEIIGDKKCGKTWYKEDKQCCVKGMLFKKCEGRCLPPSEYAVQKKEGTCQPKGCYYKEYTIFFSDSQNLDLENVLATEVVRNRKQVDSRRPVCPWDPPKATIKPLTRGPNGLFAITDRLGIPGEATITKSCAHQEEQIVIVDKCLVQTNTLIFEADPSGARRISRSDEKKKQ